MSYFEEQTLQLKEALNRAEAEGESHLLHQAMLDAINWHLAEGDYTAAAAITMCFA